ncbi:ATP-dependent DNA helicase RecG [Algoriella xinjiangensis]|uniref:ATP-dependent DNA helicase RecG n=1 Tax=Algoriella xinjiangensis TaxID=684065 RepID=A0A1I5BDY0_9FLAO|nr:ATP-binding protein [Algoriella xinjiangensis]SFN72880.1 ATP-dependent DNA helicase RecG [Algoriella xinjiangensis]VDH16931.1 Divergent AAA domain [Algoriella xinjiangensis]
MKIDTIIITQEQVNKILEIEESHFADFKSKRISPSKLTNTISALANAVGGEVYIGIEEIENKSKKSWDGFSTIEDANGFIQVFEKLFPLGDNFSYTFLHYNNSYVLKIEIKKNKDIIVANDGEIYKRRSAQNLKIRSQEEIERLKLDKGLYSFEDNTLDIPVEFVSDSLSIYEFMIEIIPTNEPLAWLKKQLLILGDKPKVSAVLLFSDEPQAALPKQSAIKIYKYRTKALEGTRETLDFDPISIEGNLYNIIKESVAKVKEIIESSKILDEYGLQSVNYPAIALHEIITNAVLHRDYSIQADIHIRIFDNRVEIESPGVLPGHVTIRNILNEQFARNGTLVRLINKFPDAPNKDVGEGLNSAFDEIKNLRLKKPSIVEKENSVLVTILHEPLASAEQLIIEYLETHDEITNAEGRELTGVSSADIMKQTFYKLRDKGLIKKSDDDGKQGRKSSWIKIK